MAEFSYPNSPGMTGKNRFRKIPTYKPKKSKEGRTVNPATGQPEFSHGRKQTCTLRYRDGKTLELFYPTITDALASGTYISFKRADLSGLDLSGAVCRNRDFSEASFKGTKLTGAVLDRCVFDKVQFSACDLSGASCKGCSFVEASLNEETKLEKTILDYADLTDIKGMEYANITGVSIEGVKGIDMDDIEPPSNEEGEEEESYTPEEQAELAERKRWDGLTEDEKIAEIEKEEEE